ncbi:IS110 family transposase [Mycolicibacterium agri]|uniref:IS110 family transposase n=1 Tax=Mycolicibacterium agri TaxID=36811 RepID=A0A7I9W6P0_MYCAG|nr:IS110 family transposase [Mycolicibacterium agri]GFG53364.1 IS110 family transposase [Mycolicibacterium agri]
MEVVVGQQLWAGVDAGKSEHHCVVIDGDGQRLLSQRVANDETVLLELIQAVITLADGGDVTWAIDLNHGGAALLITLLITHEQRLLYIPGRTVHHASGGYRGDGKTDAKDAAIIADQARMRRDLQPLRAGDEIAVDLRILTARRIDLVADRTRAINRLRAQLLEYFPALERAFDYGHSKAALILLTGYQTPDALRRAGVARLEAWLRKRKAYNATAVAATAIAAANAQHSTVPGQQIAAAMVARLAKEVMALDTEIGDTETMIEDRFRRHRHAEIILSMPGFGVQLGAEFLAATGGDMTTFDSVDRLAACPGWPRYREIPARQRQPQTPRRYDRRLLRACYLSAQIAIRTDPASRTYYDRKRSEGKTHTQAILALARRRLNVLWAMLRDHAVYQPTTTAAAA